MLSLCRLSVDIHVPYSDDVDASGIGDGSWTAFGGIKLVQKKKKIEHVLLIHDRGVEIRVYGYDSFEAAQIANNAFAAGINYNSCDELPVNVQY